ncbi:MAG: hypothetical protein ACRCZ0_11230 [Cetobacterium sp.]
MLSQNVIIAIVTIIIGIGVVYGTNKEEFCNCTGMGARTAYPTYYTYRPFGDVSDYSSSPSNGNGQFIKIGADNAPTNSFFNLGWKTGMPYDSFVASMNNNWAAGSDPYFKTHSSVPMLAMGPSSNIHKFKNGGYATNYGDSFNDELGPIKVPQPISGSQFVNGQYGFPNMLSNGQPELIGPAGSFSESAMPCGANAYNLGVGVL